MQSRKIRGGRLPLLTPFTIYLGLAAWMASCGETTSPTPPSSSAKANSHLEWRIDGTAFVPAARELYASHPIPEDLGSWQTSSPHNLIDSFPGTRLEAGRKTLVLGGTNEKVVEVRGPFETARFNRGLLRAVVHATGRLRVEALNGDTSVGAPLTIALTPAAKFQDIVIDVQQLALDQIREIDAFRFTLDGDLGPIALRLLELLLVDASAPAQPEFSLEPGTRGRVSLDSSSREAWALTKDQALRVEFLPQAGELLRFSACLDPHASNTGGARSASLRVLLESDDESALFEYSYELDSDWRLIEVNLFLFKDKPSKLTLELHTQAGSTPFALIEPPRALTPLVDPPTVLLITSDTHRGDHLLEDPDGHRLRTPTLRSLMERGLTFERAFSSSNITLPSHAALLTGRHPRDTGVLSNTQGLNESAPTLAEAFREAGWSTIASISARHLFEWGGTAQGFDRFDSPLAGQRTGSETLGALRRDMDEFADQPLFLWLHLYDPHTPYSAPPRYADPQLELMEPGLEGEARELGLRRAHYRGEIGYVDGILGKLLRETRMPRALVAFTADHGENLGELDRSFNHDFLYGQVVHVPLILAGPALPDAWRGQRVFRNTSHLDVGRTLLDLAGMPGTEFPGSNLLVDRLLDEGDEWNGDPLFAISNDGLCASITHGRDHLLLHLAEGKGQRTRHRFELYDLAQDPGCANDLVDERLEDALDLRRSLIRWLERAEPTHWAAIESPATEGLDKAALLEELGYAGSGQSREDWLPQADCDCDWCSRSR